MTYACAHIVYGIELPAGGDYGSGLQRLADRGLVDTSYNGMGDSPFWVGVEMGFIDATSSSLAKCRLQPTEADLSSFEEKRDALLARLSMSGDPGSMRLAWFVRAAVPGPFLAWGSS